MVELEDFWDSFSDEFTIVLRKTEYANRVYDFQELLKTLILISLNRIKMTDKELDMIESQKDRSDDYNEDEDEDEDGAEIDLRAIEEKAEYYFYHFI